MFGSYVFLVGFILGNDYWYLEDVLLCFFCVLKFIE